MLTSLYQSMTLEATYFHTVITDTFYKDDLNPKQIQIYMVSKHKVLHLLQNSNAKENVSFFTQQQLRRFQTHKIVLHWQCSVMCICIYKIHVSICVYIHMCIYTHFLCMYTHIYIYISFFVTIIKYLQNLLRKRKRFDLTQFQQI